MLESGDIRIRDPFIVPVTEENTYYLFGTTDRDPWKAAGVGFDAYKSSDLHNWEGPFRVFTPPKGFWGTHNFWAPEVHKYRGRYYMLASFTAPGHCRGTQVLVSRFILGPYLPVSPKPATPPGWECLDGTLWVDPQGRPWLVFCHEWVQVNDGEICALPLTDDLSEPEGDPCILFRASDAEWTRAIMRRDGSGRVDARVTDGPFLYPSSEGGLIMLWSSLSSRGYAMGSAGSPSGNVLGPWIQRKNPIIDTDGGHGMVFRRFDGALFCTFHTPNTTPLERFTCVMVHETGDSFTVFS
ncbi:MAG: family 43 glycosylhydrolase [Spirochaetales bacterium]|nr:family 43 glycosylhydrolase [Spirochaetales bacterium]